jgi:hypothetical protein
MNRYSIVRRPFRVASRPVGLPVTIHATTAAAARRAYRRRFPVLTEAQRLEVTPL